MGKRQLRRQETLCRERLRALEMTVNLRAITTVLHLCDVLAARRQRPIHLEARPLPPPLAGLWLASATADDIFYAEDAPPLLQEHTIFHELAHLLLGVQESMPPELGEWETRRPVPPLSPQMVSAALKRSCYDDTQERMAELLASLIEQRWRAVRLPDGVLPPAAPAPQDIRWLAAQARDALR